MKQRIKTVEDEIHEKELLIEELDHKLCDETIYSDPMKLKEVMDAKALLQKSLDMLMQEWEELLI